MTKIKHPLTREEFEMIYSKVPRLCVEVIVQTPQGIVLTRRTDPPAIGQWHIPGGTVHKDERLHSAVQRIAQEELHLLREQITTPEMLGVIEYDFSEEDYSGFPVGIAYLITTQQEPKRGRSADAMGMFHKLPTPMIAEQAQFLAQHHLITV